MKYFFIGLFFMTSCNHVNSRSSSEPNLDHLNYLEDVESDKSMAFVKSFNEKALSRYQNQPTYINLHKEIFLIHTDKEKMPHYFFVDQDIYYFWQDDQHIKGQLRKIKNIFDQNKEYTVILDLDHLSMKENKNWDWSGLACLRNDKNHCIIYLSNGGKDAIVSREFNLNTKKFVENGFYIPESKSHVTWINKDTLILHDGTNSRNLTSSGYASELRILHRNQELPKSEVLFKVSKNSMSVYFYSVSDNNNKYHFIIDQIDFYNSKKYFISDMNQPKEIIEIQLPNSSEIIDIFKNQVIVKMREHFNDPSGFHASAGSIVSFPITQIASPQKNYQLLFENDKNQIASDYRRTKNKFLVSYMHDVITKIKIYDYTDKWIHTELHTKKNDLVDLEFTSTSLESDFFLINQKSFLSPPELLLLSDQDIASNYSIYKGPHKFKSDDLTVKQIKVKSINDGIEIPYFLIHKKNLDLNTQNPTILYGYGGFELSRTPYYMSVSGKVWLEKGGVYVLANIRGGGEYGPEWHRAALKENRQKAFDDFYSVALDLIDKKITSPKHLGIWGGSNGGLLTSVAFTQRPELFNAVIAEVPLANMMRYHKLLAGSSWMAEYGNPDKPSEREYILKYSPLQNLKPNQNYPEVLFITSTKDDRVHPAHARQMAARMQEFGYPVLFYENINGGHKRASDPQDTSMIQALEYTYLWEKLK